MASADCGFAYNRSESASVKLQGRTDRSGDANGWVAGVDSTVTVFSDAGVSTLPKYRSDREYSMSSFGTDGLVVGGTSAADQLMNRPLIWRCR